MSGGCARFIYAGVLKNGTQGRLTRGTECA